MLFYQVLKSSPKDSEHPYTLGGADMSRFAIRWLNEKTLKISGTIDEYFSLDSEFGKFSEEIFLDMRGVSRINSCGVREWIKFMGRVASRVHYVNCSSIIVAQFSMIPEFIGKKGVVDSFEVQFVCPRCGHEDALILTVGKDILPGRETYSDTPDLICSECSSAMECDHDPELYFSFLSEVPPLAEIS